MARLLDLVFCIGLSSTMAHCHSTIRRMILYFFINAPLGPGDRIRLAFILFRSTSDLVSVELYPFTDDVDMLHEYLANITSAAETLGGDRAIGHALQEVLRLPWSPDKDGEKLTIVITDGAPSGLFSDLIGPDTWQITKALATRFIRLCVVGVQPDIAPCYDFYCALSQLTGAQYVPFTSLSVILENLSNGIFEDGQSIFEVFREFNLGDNQSDSSFEYKAIEKRVEDMKREGATINNIRRAFYNYLRSRP